ncbi:MAG: hypothetical protein OXS35_05535, partial [Dehalococcoidia bacterium]|nr:hypothetical protein [Dehalococcoidia bacterium]
AWHVVSRHLATYATPKRTAEGAREWLDSRMGRHFADYLTDAINGGLTIHKALVTDMARSHIVRRHDAPFGGR